MHAFVNGLFKPKDEATARELFDRVKRLFSRYDLDTSTGRVALAILIAEDVLDRLEEGSARPSIDDLASLILSIFDYEALFELPVFDWSKLHSVSDYWELITLTDQRALLDDFDDTGELITLTLCHCLNPHVFCFWKDPQRRQD